MTIRRTAGGAATAGGMDFQHRVTAWVAVRILAEKEISLPWNLPVTATLEWLRCETEQPVDDLLVGTSDGGLVFSQIKHTLQLSVSVNSNLAAAFNQFVRQFVAYRATAPGKRPWERPLDPVRDRLVLITGPGSSLPIRDHLPRVLDRLQGLVQGQPLDDAAVNQAERRVLSVAANHVKKAWQAALGVLPADNEIRQFLSLIRVQVLDVDDGGADENMTKDRLRNAVLHDPGQADTAWALLITACARLAAARSGTERHALQQFFLNVGIDLQAPRSYRDDIERLRAHSQTTVDRIAHLARIQIGATEVKIPRHSTEELRRAAEEDALLVVGVPGAGKSGALHDLVQKLRDEGRDVVFLAVDHLAACSLGEIRQELGIDHDLTEILANWPGTASAFLVIDALDAARAELTARTIRGRDTGRRRAAGALAYSGLNSKV